MRIAGCLSSRHKNLPFPEAELLEALLTCERDHVAFIHRELGFAPARAISPHGAPSAISKQTAGAGAVVPATTRFDRLKRFIKANEKGGFRDLRAPRPGKPARRHPKGRACPWVYR